jgi:hypothetical protein
MFTTTPLVKGSLALASAIVLLASLCPNHANALTTIECQHPVMTGVEIYKLHDVTPRRACPVALALFRWETSRNSRPELAEACA